MDRDIGTMLREIAKVTFGVARVALPTRHGAPKRAQETPRPYAPTQRPARLAA